MDEAEMAADEFREGVVGPVPGIAREQFQIGVAHVQKCNVTGKGNPPNFLVASIYRLHLSMMDKRNVRLPKFGDAGKALEEV
jgi:hypothetical protein